MSLGFIHEISCVRISFFFRVPVGEKKGSSSLQTFSIFKKQFINHINHNFRKVRIWPFIISISSGSIFFFNLVLLCLPHHMVCYFWLSIGHWKLYQKIIEIVRGLGWHHILLGRVGVCKPRYLIRNWCIQSWTSVSARSVPFWCYLSPIVGSFGIPAKSQWTIRILSLQQFLEHSFDPLTMWICSHPGSAFQSLTCLCWNWQMSSSQWFSVCHKNF